MSVVPAPMSTIARFNSRSSAGMAAFMAAMGSNVILDTWRPAARMAAYRLSTTSPGRKVATTSASIRRPVWNCRLFMG